MNLVLYYILSQPPQSLLHSHRQLCPHFTGKIEALKEDLTLFPITPSQICDSAASAFPGMWLCGYTHSSYLSVYLSIYLPTYLS